MAELPTLDEAPAVGQRRARRRAETIEEILRLALEIMSEAGAGGLTFAELARRLGVRPPSLYKYFGSVHAVYDELFRRGQLDHLRSVADAMSATAPGMPAVVAGLTAGAQWSAEHAVLAQLLFWRPVPGFEPTPDAFAPSIEMVDLFRRALKDAVAAGQVGPQAADDRAVALVSVIAAGTASQYLANEPGTPWRNSRYLTLLPHAVDVLTAAYRPAGTKTSSAARMATAPSARKRST